MQKVDGCHIEFAPSNFQRPSTKDSPVRARFSCPYCDQPSSFKILRVYEYEWKSPEVGFLDRWVWFITAQCDAPSCRRIVFVKATTKGSFDEDDKAAEEASIAPGYKPRSVGPEIPEEIDASFKEAQLCFNVAAYRGCAVMCRRVLWGVVHDRKCAGGSLQKSINALVGEEKLRSHMARELAAIKEDGDAGAHPEILHEVTGESASEILAYTETLLEEIYVQPNRINERTMRSRRQAGTNK